MVSPALLPLIFSSWSWWEGNVVVMTRIEVYYRLLVVSRKASRDVTQVGSRCIRVWTGVPSLSVTLSWRVFE